MQRRLALAALLALAPSLASAQFATIGATSPTTDNSDRVATTAYVNSFFAQGTPLSNITGLGTGVGAALGTNIGSAGSVILNGGAAGGDLSGTYPNPSVAKIGGVSPTFATAAAATKANQQTGTSSTVVVTPSQQQSHDSAAKAHISFVGSTAAVNESYNATVTRGSTGTYTVSFTTSFASAAAYTCVGSAENNLANTFIKFGSGANKTTGSISVFSLNLSGSLADSDNVSVVCFGRQ